MAASVTLSNPLGADDAQRVGLSARAYEVGETVTVDDWVAAAWIRVGYAAKGAPVTNSLLTGNGPPDSGIGANGSYYLDVLSQVLYGPKVAGQWPIGISPGRGITSAAAVNGRLTVSFTDGGEMDAGPLPAGPQGAKGDPGDLTGSDGPITWPASTQDLRPWNTPATKVRVLGGDVIIGFLPTDFGQTRSGTITLIVRQAPSGGPYTLTWPASLKWVGDAPAPLMPTTPNAELTVHLFWTGQAWRGAVMGVVTP